MKFGDLFFPDGVPDDAASVGKFVIIMGRIKSEVLIAGTASPAFAAQDTIGCDNIRPFFIVGAASGNFQYRYAIPVDGENSAIVDESALAGKGRILYSLSPAAYKELAECIAYHKFYPGAFSQFLFKA